MIDNLYIFLCFLSQMNCLPFLFYFIVEGRFSQELSRVEKELLVLEEKLNARERVGSNTFFLLSKS